MRFELKTRAAPEQTDRALPDLAERRLQTWNRTLDLLTDELREQGDSWAVARGAAPGRRSGWSPIMTGLTPTWSVGELQRAVTAGGGAGLRADIA